MFELPTIRSRWIFRVSVAIGLMGLGYVVGETAGESLQSPLQLVGTWQQVAVTNGKEVRPAKQDGSEVKLLHITPTHFTRTVYNPKTKRILGIVGGACPLSTDKHIETIEYGDDASLKAAEGTKALEFHVKLERDILTLTLPDQGPYSEVWKRAK